MLGRTVLLSVVILAAFAAVLFAMGRVPICTCGFVELWHGVTPSAENSQHLSDWYSFSHVIHGFAFYGILWWFSRRRGWSLGFRFLLALLLEVGWEIFENSPFIVNRYRAVTVSFDYYGDSIVNAVGDVLFMALGFLLAARLPVWAIVALTIAMEVGVAMVIRDNLTLNIIMLLFPLEAIRRWQLGSPPPSLGP